jgi:hypothetical protein
MQITNQHNQQLRKMEGGIVHDNHDTTGKHATYSLWMVPSQLLCFSSHIAGNKL